MKRSQIILALILLSAGSLCTALWVNDGPLWWWVMTKAGEYEYSRDGHLIRGQSVNMRFGDRRLLRCDEWYVENGFRRAEGWRSTGKYPGAPERQTQWDFDGRVVYQSRVDADGSNARRESSPWWWGVTDQTEPTAPWWGKE